MRQSREQQKLSKGWFVILIGVGLLGLLLFIGALLVVLTQSAPAHPTPASALPAICTFL